MSVPQQSHATFVCQAALAAGTLRQAAALDDGSRERRADARVSNESEPKRRLRDQTDDHR
jgi:hypothetical protein